MGRQEAPGVSRFIMKSGPANPVYLERKLYGGTAGTEPAYWLPWKSKTGVALDLGDNIKILTTIGSI